MPKKGIELSAIQVKRLDKPGMHAVGGVAGLLLQVSKSGARSWILRATVGSRRRDIGLGGFPDVTLAQAREKARVTRGKIDQGFDPIEERKAAKVALRASQAKRLSFAEAARRKHEAIAPEFRNARSRANWLSSLELYAVPVVGDMEVADVEMSHVLSVIEPIWRDKTHTANRVRQRMEAVFDWAIARKYRETANPAAWKGNLAEVLPKPTKISTVKHHRALPWQEIPGFMRRLRKRTGMSARALEFAILTAARSGEVRFATWNEIDLDAALWVVPGQRTKNGKAHRVPLSKEVVALLRTLPRFENEDTVFTASRGGSLSDMSLSSLTRKMDVDAVPHGFRSSFKDWARNCTDASDEVSELALAHVNSDSTRAAYARDELLEQRSIMMEQWARFCCNPIPLGE
ncbi:phage integrase [Salinisphaera shabanensis T35B1]|jgi:integrase|uniref:Alanine-synthesizing transaminase protein n=1 Tax=Salinisphaera shabanensis E1L3A TaxID=1033802 RepID=U2FU27_9GAMM|nr:MULTISPECIES: site-specific integrase [Salinisphaera]ERJ17888.1 alanine-synthesizing transaminase protein [Salinisphaera shabanensis E1L3A]MBS63459.1 integrase [Salinisphaera sp.]